MDNGAFSGTGGSHNADCLTGLNRKGNVMKDFMTVLLVERNVRKLDFPVYMVKNYGFFRLCNGWLFRINTFQLSVGSNGA